jgi:hypothetical protein
MLGAVSARLGQEKVRDQFATAPAAGSIADGSFAAGSSRCLGKRPRTVTELARLCGFDAALAPSVERLVPLVLSTPSAKEAT